MLDTTTVSRDDGPRWLSWLVLGLGTLCILAGVIVLMKPSDSLETLAVIVGIFLLVDGVLEMGLSLSRHTEGRGTVALLGVLNAVVGVLLIRHPLSGVTAIALFIAIWLVALGVLRFVGAFETPAHRMWSIVIALIEVGVGVAIMVDPEIGYATLALLVGIGFILRGMAFCAFGLLLHAAGRPTAVPGAPAGAAPA